ncbi:DUF4124 domain-containing protein [Neisseria sp. Marseille-Q6792]|uniref:DUF4124 domain-containing protein n=1 Tax=Neisseria sp. Marseille-Q6792 TaxID=2937985 RepID=UPI002024D5D7|nr:DUF4124 domain-containing protein [Neisseria sp. Marseille-Q6792]
MKTSKIIAGLMLAVAVQTASAAVYECRQNGKVSYSQTPRKHCTNAGLGRDQVYSSVRPAVKDRAENTGADDNLDMRKDEHIQNSKENTHKDASNTGAKTH